VFFPASIAILFFGIWMVLDQAVWAFGQTWIVFGLVVSILSAAVGMAYFGRRASGWESSRPSAASTTARFRAA
jgi:hypothetical protein